MYEILMALPLFHGVSYSRLSEVVGSSKFHFLKYSDGENVVEAGQPCTHIKFLISGSVRVSVCSPDGSFSVTQTVSRPDVIAPEFLFGRETRYPCNVTAVGAAGILQISKSDYVRLLNSDQIFLFNFLNMLSAGAQNTVNGILAISAGSLCERIAFWVVAMTRRGAEDIVLSCGKELHTLFGVSRPTLAAALSAMKSRGLIDCSDSRIFIRSRAGLVAMLAESLD